MTVKFYLVVLRTFYNLTVANGIFVQRDFSIRDEYREVVENVYRSEIKVLNFRREPQQAAKYINK